jgi:hypothetical protein
VAVLGQPAEPAAYLTDLRHLTTLLLHLAGQPGAEALAPWVSDLAAVAAERTGVRGPRWGLRPPDDPKLRGKALATADAILAAGRPRHRCHAADAVDRAHPDHERRAARVARRPHRHDPTLTRLVMAARPRTGACLTTSTPPEPMERVCRSTCSSFPKSSRTRQYLEHLDGAFDSSEATVRIFASLSLARLHPDIKSWAAAAEAFGMPGPMGVRCARACSATMLVTADEWKARIWRARSRTPKATTAHSKPNPPPTRDERLVRRMGPPLPTRHARQQLRPRPDLAMGPRRPRPPRPLTRLAREEPTAKDRARYRQFEASLDAPQERYLRLAIADEPDAGDNPTWR